MWNEEYDKLIEASNVVCMVCLCRSEENCDKCTVRYTIDNFFKK